MSSEERVLCVYCEKSLKNSVQLRKHLRNVHKVRKEPNHIKCGEEDCLESFSTLMNYREHLEKLHKYKNIS
ncbi:hypothetical protein X975_24732, partial [Stegodyphus mimosarum]